METSVITGIRAIRSLVNADDATIKSVLLGWVTWMREREREDILLVVHGAHGGFSIVLSREAHETKTAAAKSIAVLDDNLVKTPVN